MKVGCIIGRFSPLHNGHIYLMEEGVKQVDKLYILICFTDGETIPTIVRKKWVEKAVEKVKEKYSTKEIVINILTKQFINFKSEKNSSYEISKQWSEYLKFIYPDITHFIGGKEYIKMMADAIGCEYITINEDRKIEEVSLKKIDYKDYLPDYVVKDYVFKICIIGIESSGKTTLIRELGRQLNCPYVEEYGRIYCQINSPLEDGKDYFLTRRDFHNIAIGHNRLVLKEYEHALASKEKFLFVDTDHIITQCFFKRYLDKNGDKKLQDMIQFQEYDLFVWVPPVKFEDDGTRRIYNEDVRLKQIKEVKEEFLKNGIELVELKEGLSIQERVDIVKKILHDKFKKTDKEN